MSSPKATPHSVSALTYRVALVFLGMMLTRQDFATAFGQGTGQNKVHLSPLSIVASAIVLYCRLDFIGLGS